MRVISEPRKTVQVESHDNEGPADASRQQSPEEYRGQTQAGRARPTPSMTNFATRLQGNGGKRQRSNSVGSTVRTPLMTAPTWQSADQRSGPPRFQYGHFNQRQQQQQQQVHQEGQNYNSGYNRGPPRRGR